MNENAAKLMIINIDLLERGNSSKEDIRKAVDQISTIYKAIFGKNMSYVEFMSIYGKYESDMRSKLYVKAVKMLEHIVNIEQ